MCAPSSKCSHQSERKYLWRTWWRHELETFSALLAICAGNSPGTAEFPAQRPVTRSFHGFFDLRQNKPLSKQSWGWWFETLSRPLWRHCNGLFLWHLLHDSSIVIHWSKSLACLKVFHLYMFCLIFLKDIYYYLLRQFNFTFDKAQDLYKVHCISVFHRSGLGHLFTRMTPTYRFKNPYYKTKTARQPSHTYNGNPFTNYLLVIEVLDSFYSNVVIECCDR